MSPVESNASRSGLERPDSAAPWRRLEHPALYQVFARVWLAEVSGDSRRRTLDAVPDDVIARLADRGFDWLYLMGVWTLGPVGVQIAREHDGLRGEYGRALPGWTDEDVAGSPFAVASYRVAPALGGDDALARFREALDRRGIRLMLDFIPNHVARDHHWIGEHPEIFVRDAWGEVQEGGDPHSLPWTDTSQLDLRLEATHAALSEALASIADRCDGVRCDMAMLVLADVFDRTWKDRPPTPGAATAHGEFWVRAIDRVRARHPSFTFVAEAYWGLEWRLQMLGFDYTYDKTFYDRLVGGSAASVMAHLAAGADYQRRSVRFLENHDEPRAASLPEARHRAAAVLFATAPGMRFFHDGQLEGRRLRLPVQLARRHPEPVDARCLESYEALLRLARSPALRRGSFARLEPGQAGAESRPEAFVAYRWQAPEQAVAVIVNFSDERATCRVPFDVAGIGGRKVELVDRVTGEAFVRDGDELLDTGRGLFVELPAFGYHVLDVAPSRYRSHATT